MSVQPKQAIETIVTSFREFGFTQIQCSTDKTNFFVVGKLEYVNLCVSCNVGSGSYDCDILANKGYHNLVSDIPTMTFSTHVPLEMNVLRAIRVAYIQERVISKYMRTRDKFAAISQLKKNREMNNAP